MKRALVITPFSPVPDDEGHRKRILSTIRLIEGMGYRIDLLFACLDDFWVDRASRAQRRALEALVDHLHVVVARQPPPAPPGQDYGIDDWVRPEFRSAAAWLAARNDYDLVWCNYVFLSQLLLPFGPQVAKVIDTHDRAGGRADLLRANGSPVQFFHTTAAEEARGLDRADLVLSIKDEEAAYFRDIGRRPVINLPYVERRPVAAPDAAEDGAGRAPGVRFGFLGSANQINRKNLLDFLDVYRRHPRVLAGDRLDIRVYGGVCDLLGGLSCPGVTVAGRMGAVEDFYAAVDCVLVPQHFSTGLKIKVAEAMSRGMPVLAHAHAAEGLVEGDDWSFLCGDFATLAEECYRARDEAGRLDRLREEVAAAQDALLRRTAEATRGIAAFLETARTPATLVVDGDLLARSPFYRLALRSVVLGLSPMFRFLLVGFGSTGLDALEVQVGGWGQAATLALGSARETLERLLAEDWGACLLACHLPTPELAALGAARKVVRLDALVAHQARRRGVEVAALPPGGVAVRSAFQLAPAPWSGGEPVQSVIHFRWLPWELGRVARGPGGSEAAAVVVAIPCGDRRRGVGGILTVCACGRCGDLSIEDLERRMLTEGVAPWAVIDESGGSVEFSLLYEALFWMGIPLVRAPDEAAEAEGADESLYDRGVLGVLWPRAADRPTPPGRRIGLERLAGLLRGTATS